MRDQAFKTKYITIGFIVIVLAFSGTRTPCLADGTTSSASLNTDALHDISLHDRTPLDRKKLVNSQGGTDTQEVVVTAKKTAIIKVDTSKQAAAVIVIPEALLKPSGPNAKSAKESTGGFFGPVTRLEEEVVRLEVEMSKLIAPMTGLQPGISGLDKQVSGVLQQTVNLQEQIGGLQGKIGDTTNQMASMQNNIKALRIQLGTLILPMQELRDPIIQLHSPMVDIRKPLTSVGAHLAGVDTRFAGLDRRFTGLDSRFVELDTRFATLDTRFATLGNQLERLQVLLSMILNSAIAGAVIIVTWLLIAAVLSQIKTSNAEEHLSKTSEKINKHIQRSFADTQ